MKKKDFSAIAQFKLAIFSIAKYIFYNLATSITKTKRSVMRKADIVNIIADKSGMPKVDVLLTLESFIKEIKIQLTAGENVYIRGFGSFITKKRAVKIGRNIKKNIAVTIPAHYVPAFKPAKEFVEEVKTKYTPDDVVSI